MKSMKKRYLIISRTIATLLFLLYVAIFKHFDVVPLILVLIALFSSDYFVKTTKLLEPKND